MSNDVEENMDFENEPVDENDLDSLQEAYDKIEDENRGFEKSIIMEEASKKEIEDTINNFKKQLQRGEEKLNLLTQKINKARASRIKEMEVKASQKIDIDSLGDLI